MKKGAKLVLLSLLLAMMLSVFAGIASAYNCYNADNNQTLCQQHTNECKWESPWCNTFDCWSFYTQSECNTNATALGLSCTWKTNNWGWCEQINCVSFEGTNQTACETTSDNYGLNCQWSESSCTGGGMGVNCWDYTTAATCRAVSNCKWGSCYEKGCWAYSTSPTCEGDSRCDWDSTYSYCKQTGCWDHSTNATCGAASGCYWSTSSNSCQQKSCWDYNYNQTACLNNTVTDHNCYYSNNMCMESGCSMYSSSNTCQAATGVNCTWKVNSGGFCEKTNCWSYDSTNQNTCEDNAAGIDCVWNNGWCNRNISAVNCGSYTTEQACIDSMFCWWDFGQQQCNAPMGGGTGAFAGGFMMKEWNPGCYIFDMNRSFCGNVSGCTWNGTNCRSNQTIIDIGIKCEYINDSFLCNNMPSLAKCCQWSGGSCTTDNFTMSCHNNMQAPPMGAAFCDDYNSFTTQSLCEQIANYPWFMPCKWNNATQECKFKSEDAFGAGNTGGFEELSSEKNCEYAGGLWVEENYCVNTTSVPAGWCEMKFGAGGGKKCDTQCWACEFNDDGTNPTSATAAQDKCKGSKLGTCEWRTDTSAPNGYGYCELKEEFKYGATDCDTDCWACEKKGNWQSGGSSTPKYYCENSDANCKWEQDLSTTDTTKGWCMPATDKTCGQECVKCLDQASCVSKGKGGSNACTWDSNSKICKTTGAAAGEICFDGMDNDGDGDVDCTDKNCMYDTFCGGAMMGNSCSQYDEDLCGQKGCTWKLTTTTTGYCTELGEKCYEYDGNQSACANATVTGTPCQWTSGSAMCEVNESKAAPCRMKGKTDCQADPSCAYFDDPYCVANPSVCSGGWCDGKMEACMMNVSKNNQTKCEDNNCKWNVMSFFGGSDFGMMSSGGSCEAKCHNGSLNTADLCKDDCTFVNGYCNPAGMGAMTGGGMMFGGNCWMYDNNKTGCIALTECSWMSNPQPFCDVNMTSMGCGQYTYSEDTCKSQPGCRWTGNWCDSAAFECGWNSSLSISETNCRKNPNCAWRAAEQRCDNVCFGQSQTNCQNVTLKPVCLWKEGFCGGAMMGQMFNNMEAGAPVQLGTDTCPEGGMLAALDICRLGVKEMKDTYMFGLPAQSFKDAAICNGKYTPTGMGSGKNATMYYLYLDTDGSATGSCNSSASAAADKVGYEFMFKDEVTWDSTGGQPSETKTAFKCSNNAWVSTDIKLSNMPEKMCNEINGPMVGISKSDITKLTSLFDMTKPMRVYAATADNSSNRLSPTDSVGPFYYTSGSADAKMENCMLKGADMDGDGLLSEEDPDCEWFTKNGFIKFEDCYSPQDDDGDNLLNCSDPDCRCDESDCSDIPICNRTGVNAVGYTDNAAPKIIYYRMDEYVDAALLYYDTNEAANGTVSFYGTDTTCTSLNATIDDVGVWNPNVKQFKGWHEAPFENSAHSLNYNLLNGTAYYYKMKVCDKSGNCLASACMNFTTAVSLNSCPACDFVFKLSVPTGWNVHMDLNKDNVYEIVQGDMCGETAGTLINYTRGRNVSIYLNHTDDNTGMYFYSIRLSKGGYNSKIKAMSDASNLKSGTTNTSSATAGYTGMNAETRDKIINKLHPQQCRVKIPSTGTCTALWHCDDNLTNCVDMASKATLIQTGANFCLWQIPYCEFSTWSGGKPAARTTTPTTPGSSASSSAGGVGGSGTMAGGTSPNPSISYLFESIMAEEEETMSINKEGLALTKIAFILKKNVTDVEINIEALPEAELVPPKLDTPVHQYVKIAKSGIADEDIKGVTINFKVLKEWLNSNNIAKENVVMMVYNGAAWENAASTTLQQSSSITGAVVGASGGSWLRTVWDWITFPFRWLKGAITGYAVYAPSDYEYYVAKMGIMNYVAITGSPAAVQAEAAAPAAERAAEEAKLAEEKPAEEKAAGKAAPWLAYIVVLAAVILASVLFLARKKKGHKKEESKIETGMKEISELFKKK